MEHVIYCKDLIKSYGRKRVLKGIDLEVPKGTIFGLLGTNGAGKTTLIRSLLGLIPSDSGEVRVLGEEPYKIGPSLRQNIGYVSEEQGLYRWMKIEEIISFCRSLYPNWDNNLVDKYLHKFGLNVTNKIGNLSKGQCTKLALILALAPKPELLILDEPMSGLDPLAQYEFLRVITKDVAPEGRSVFFSTHNIADVEAVAQYVAIEFDGKIQASGTIDEVCSQILKIKVPASYLPSLGHHVVLDESEQEVTALVHAGQFSEIAAASENFNHEELKPTLKDAFLFFCSGGDLK